jgi:hypothetical protein
MLAIVYGSCEFSFLLRKRTSELSKSILEVRLATADQLVEITLHCLAAPLGSRVAIAADGQALQNPVHVTSKGLIRLAHPDYVSAIVRGDNRALSAKTLFVAVHAEKLQRFAWVYLAMRHWMRWHREGRCALWRPRSVDCTAR